MVQTSDRLGIGCDLCGTVVKKKFVYYNLVHIHRIRVDTRVKDGLESVDKRILDIDMCDNCWQEIVGKIKNQIKKRSTAIPDEWTTTVE